MITEDKRVLYIYIILDYIASVISWGSFFVYRKKVETPWHTIQDIVQDDMFIPGLSIIPLAWIVLYGILGSYGPVYRKSRLITLYDTFILSVIGCLGLLFLVLVDDTSLGYVTYFESFIVLLGLQLFWVIILRIVYLNYIKGRLSRGKARFQTVLISDQAVEKAGIPVCNYIIESFNTKEDWKEGFNKRLTDAEDVMVDVADPDTLRKVIDQLGWHVSRIVLQLSDRAFEASRHEVRVQPWVRNEWVTLHLGKLPLWQSNVKRLIDVLVSIFLIVVLSPIMAFCMAKIRLSSSGNIIFRQERIGLKGRPFQILKFRSMYMNAEENGPELSFDGDERCTPWGAVMRKWRLDELPQFFNVLKGNMSLVGPRPERSHYIQQLKGQVPGYDKLLSVRPGITSWGQVKYGYASNVEEMLKRLRYDMLYVDNMHLLLDFKIIYHTIVVLFQGKGK